MNIYLDNNATTALDPEVKKAMEPFWSDQFANPSSAYESGVNVRRRLEEAREGVAQLIGARQDREIIFTSGGTESNNTAIRSVLKSRPTKKKIVTTQVEHSSVKNVCEQLVREDGYQVVSVGVSKTGALDWNQFIDALNDDVALVSVMWANNETGVLFPIQKIGTELKRRNILFHVDAVQAVGKIPICLKETPVNYLSFSAHKFHGPKGTGCLYVGEGSPFHSLIIGGRQERDRRGGTENTAGIIGLHAALKLTGHHSNQIEALRNQLEDGLVKRMSGSFVNGKAEARIPNTTNITIPGIEAETFLIRLSQLGIAASSGSACLTGAIEPSHVLMAMGHSKESASGSVRFSLSRFTTEREIEQAIEGITKLVEELSVIAKRQSK